MRILRISLFIFTFLCFSPTPLFAKDIRISIQIQPNQRDEFEQIFHQFYIETGIKVTSVVHTDLDYKRMVPIWLLEEQDTPDVMFWSASQRLYQYAEKDLVLPITELWEDGEYDKYFSHVKRGVTYKGEIYAIPFAYYHWGLFYRKSLIEKFGGVPDDWESFLAILSRMKKTGIIPIGIGTKQNWPAAAWFDYINLRINGLEFHLKLLNGQITFYDNNVKKVLVEWKKLIDGQFYNKDPQQYKWDGVLPYFYREKIGFMLLGNFVASRWPTTHPVMKDIGFMPFPVIDENLPYYENAPTEIFLIPKKTSKKEEAKAFIRFIARADIQTRINGNLGYIPVNKESTLGQGPFIKAGAKLLNRADGLAQFFDRDTHPDFDKLATPLLAEFINNGDIDKLIQKLEQARIEVFASNHSPN